MKLVLKKNDNNYQILQIYDDNVKLTTNDYEYLQLDDNKIDKNNLLSLLSQNSGLTIHDINNPYDIFIKENEEKYIAMYIKKEERKHITGIRKLKSFEYYDTSLFIPVSESVYNYLQKYPYLGFASLYVIDIDYIAFISELKETKEIKEIKDDDILQLELYGNHILHKLKEVLDNRIRKIDILYLFKFIELNQKLMENKYVITDENRQQKYLEIINTQDESLISILTEYSEIYEYFQQQMRLYEIYKNASEKITYGNDIQELDDIYNNVVKSL